MQTGHGKQTRASASALPHYSCVAGKGHELGFKPGIATAMGPESSTAEGSVLGQGRLEMKISQELRITGPAGQQSEFPLCLPRPSTAGQLW